MNKQLVKDLLILTATILTLYFVFTYPSAAYAQFETEISIIKNQESIDKKWTLYLLTREDALLKEIGQLDSNLKKKVDTDLFNEGDIIAWSEDGYSARWHINSFSAWELARHIFEDKKGLNQIAEKDYPYVGWNPTKVEPGHFMYISNGLPTNYGVKICYVFNDFRRKKNRNYDVIMTYIIGDDKYDDDDIGKYYNIDIKEVGRTWVRDEKRYYTRLPLFAHHLISDIRESHSYLGANASIGEKSNYIEFDILFKQEDYYKPESYIEITAVKKDKLEEYAKEPITQSQAEGIADWALRPRLINIKKVYHNRPPPPLPKFKAQK